MPLVIVGSGFRAHPIRSNHRLNCRGVFGVPVEFDDWGEEIPGDQRGRSGARGAVFDAPGTQFDREANISGEAQNGRRQFGWRRLKKRTSRSSRQFRVPIRRVSHWTRPSKPGSFRIPTSSPCGRRKESALRRLASPRPIRSIPGYRFVPHLGSRTTDGGTGSTYNYVVLQQNVQLAHQQRFREDIAASQLNQVRWNICQAELLNTAQTARLYFTALYQRGIRDLIQSNADLNEELLRISERQVAAGQITKADVAIVRIDARSTRQQADLAEANYQTALLDLRRQLNIPLETPVALNGDLIAFRWKSAHEAAVAQISPEENPAELKIADNTHLIKQACRRPARSDGGPRRYRDGVRQLPAGECRPHSRFADRSLLSARRFRHLLRRFPGPDGHAR